ncbi:DNA-binding protein [Reichenbachiella agarivorans]|uniref:DNA-binding protein n=1 Tax=Reichenbachiella agarivorans TaxID=2979464 RepID=A0ABY6CUW4_9BACT|nr:DNA-binding protein [Reichenbachiella agarivorans]UXP32025.1 DNA-binding protein [Reichenbachiella agarivorans]
MNFIKQIENLQLINKLILQERTGSPDELANRLGVSRSKLYEMIDMMKVWGLNVVYDRTARSFRFERQEALEIEFSLRVLREDESEKLYGGRQVFPSVLFSGRSGITLGLC